MVHAPSKAIRRTGHGSVAQVLVGCQLSQSPEQNPLDERDTDRVVQRPSPAGIEHAQRPIALMHMPAAARNWPLDPRLPSCPHEQYPPFVKAVASLVAAIDALGQALGPVAANETDRLLRTRPQSQRLLTATEIELDLNPNPCLPSDGGKPEGKQRCQRSTDQLPSRQPAREETGTGTPNQRFLVAFAQQPTPTACRQTKHEGDPRHLTGLVTGKPYEA